MGLCRLSNQEPFNQEQFNQEQFSQELPNQEQFGQELPNQEQFAPEQLNREPLSLGQLNQGQMQHPHHLRRLLVQRLLLRQRAIVNRRLLSYSLGKAR